jgi:integrase
VKVVVSYLIKREGRLYFRRRVPEELREIVGQREWKVSLKLKVGQELDALPLMRKLTRQTDQIIRDAEHQVASGLPEAEMAEAVNEWARRNEYLEGAKGRLANERETSAVEHETEAILKRTLLRVAKRHEDELEDDDFTPEDRLKLKVLYRGERVVVPCTIRMAEAHYKKRKRGTYNKSEAAAVDQFVDFAGDPPISQISRIQVQDWFDYLQDIRGQSLSTVKRRQNSMRAIVNKAVKDMDLNIKNPFAGHDELKHKASSKDRLPFHTSHLDLLTKHLSSERVKPETQLILTLMLETTFGVSETAGLDWSDLFLDDEIPYIKMRPNAHRSLKNESRPRDFPLSQGALGLLQTRRALSKKADGPVFSESARNYHSLSARLNKTIRAAGVPKSPRLTAYSCRHTFEEAMRVAGVDQSLQKYLMGHAEGAMIDKYGAPRPLMERLQVAVDSALPQRGIVDLANYQTDELAST